jgi:hypothetical protein
MRYFALTAIGSFAIMSAAAFCAAQAAVNSGIGFSNVRVELVKENQSNDRRGNGSDGKTRAARSRALGA